MSLRISTTLVLFAILAVLAPVRGAPTPLLNVRHEGRADNASTASSFEKQNALDAQKLNVQFITSKATDSCKTGELACINSSMGICDNGKWTLTTCASGTICVALPLVNKTGTSVVCDFKEDAITRFEAAGVNGGITGNDQNSGTKPTNDDTDENNNDDDDECDADGDDDEGDNDEDDQDCDDQDGDESPESTKTPTTSTRARETVTVTVTPTMAPASTTAASTTAASSSASVGTTILLNSPAKSSSSLPSASAEPSAATTIKLNRRQFTGIGAPTSVFGSSATVSPTSTVNAPVITTAAPSSIPPTAAVPPIIVTVTAGSASTSSITRADPTGVVLGPDGFRTVTVVSTVTVGCGASTGLLTLSSSPVSATIAASTISAVLQPVPSSASGPAPITITLNSPSPASSASSIASSSPSTNTIVSPTPTAVGGGAGGFSFSTAPSPTAAPGNVNIGGANNGAGSDFSRLLTATLG